MKVARVLIIAVFLVTLFGMVSGCTGSGTPNFTVTSSVDNNHSHNAVISGADVDNPPAQKTITSDGANHTHTITLTKQNYEAIKQGQEVTVTSSSNGATPHTHTFTIKKP